MDLELHIARFDQEAAGDPARLGPTLAAAARAAEQSGATALSLMDHYFQIEMAGPVTDPMLEGYTTLGYLAAVTERLRLRLLVTGVTYRHPGLLAKIIATLDVLSGGRAELGIGAAWFEREHAALGVPFPPLAERYERLEETLAICHQMWSEDDGPYAGAHYRLAETLCRPVPVSSPHPPILIGGSGEKKTLRLVARYADACNLFGAPPEEVAHKLDVLGRHCADAGRDIAEIRKTIIWGGDWTGSDFAGQMAPYAALGISAVVVMPTSLDADVLAARVSGAVRALGTLG